MNDTDRRVLGQVTGGAVVRATPIAGGFSAARLWSVELDDGRRLVAKIASDDESTVANRTELAVLDSVVSPRLPSLVGASDDARVLAIEDLSACDWDPHHGDLTGLWEATADIGSHAAPTKLWSAHQGAGRDAWTAVLADDRFADAVGLDRDWLADQATVLASTSCAADAGGDRLVHGDLTPGNWCATDAGVWRFVDWASAYRGNPLIDDVIASIRLTRVLGRPCPSPAVTEQPALVAFVAGRFAGELVGVDWSTAPPLARAQRIADIRAGLALCALVLGLAPPP